MSANDNEAKFCSPKHNFLLLHRYREEPKKFKIIPLPTDSDSTIR